MNLEIASGLQKKNNQQIQQRQDFIDEKKSLKYLKNYEFTIQSYIVYYENITIKK